ncbi:MAG: CobW-like GTP-binding protein, partial [Planctomycetales bacterium]
MKRTRFLMIGGFLGAGKTTAISRLAHLLIDQGLQVGVVTNDQAEALVDTET